MPEPRPRGGRSGGRFGSRLALKIYVVGLLQFLLVALGLVVATREARDEEPSTDTLRVVAESLARVHGDPAAMEGTITNASRLLRTKLGLYDDGGRLVAGTPLSGRGHGHHAGPPMDLPPPFALGGDHGGPPPPFATDPDRAAHHPPEPPGPGPTDLFPPFGGPPPGPPPGGHRMVPVTLEDGRTWRLIVTADRPLPSALRGVGVTVALVLLVVGAASWLTARSLTRPLARLSRAAVAFGSGDLAARAALTRSDELGEVAAAFDQMAERVTAALRAERELLANVSHELRTPLQRIQIAIDLAAEGDSETARESLAEIADDLAELERIVDDVLAAARLSLVTGPVNVVPLPPIHLAPTDLGALLARSAQRFRSLHPERTLDVALAEELPRLEVDATLLHRAVDNLLDNADKYTDDPAAHVELSAAADLGHLVIRVVDHGIGISTEDQAHLFEPFFRADRSRTRASGGIGLGLALAKRIVVAHGGRLDITSAPQQGTTARIELPRARA